MVVYKTESITMKNMSLILWIAQSKYCSFKDMYQIRITTLKRFTHSNMKTSIQRSRLRCEENTVTVEDCMPTELTV